MLEINEIKELVDQFDQSSLTEFDLQEGQFELYMNKNKTIRGKNNVIQPVTEKVPKTVKCVKTPIETEIKEKTVRQKRFGGVEVTSPIVGIVYLQPAPGKPAFKSVGDTVLKGEVVCIIEAMKLMNEITSETDGVIVDILVENEAVVEYGQPLFRIQPK